MSAAILLIIILGMVFGAGLLIFIAKSIFNRDKEKYNRESNSRDINPQFFKALGDFKKNTERRIANLESIVADLEEEKIRIHDKSNEGKIKIEDKDERVSNEVIDDSNLKNMLNE